MRFRAEIVNWSVSSLDTYRHRPLVAPDGSPVQVGLDSRGQWYVRLSKGHYEGLGIVEACTILNRHDVRVDFTARPQ